MTIQGPEELSSSPYYRITQLVGWSAPSIVFDHLFFFSTAVNCGEPLPIENGQVEYVSEIHEPLYKAAVRYHCNAPYYTLKNEGEGKYCVCYINKFIW